MSAERLVWQLIPAALTVVCIGYLATFHGPTINAVEWVWLASNSLALLLTHVALVDAWQLRNVVNGARRVVARGNVRREFFRGIVQSLLLFVIVPGLFVDRPIPLSLSVLCLIAVPPVILLSTILDAIERRAVIAAVRGEIVLRKGKA